ncbi:helix-turn-helix domain-containing protein [Micromonospora carbonacea]|uniref:Helix-turn-helix domain-containing protein n=1 Tax=Micromonospora carbonacea TaxID=47853 RepID=A0A1C5AKV3_9ACTN|nr:Helix-turn-helix domain-containing protein [Micromonospora carbonacea]
MGRPEGSLERDGSLATEFAYWLRDLRNRSGLTYEQLSRRTGYGKSTLQEAAAGRRLPTLDVTLAFVKACDGDEDAWRDYWTRLKRASGQGRPSGAPESLDLTPPWAAAARPPPPERRRAQTEREPAEPAYADAPSRTGDEPAAGGVEGHAPASRRSLPARWGSGATATAVLVVSVAVVGFVAFADADDRPPPAQATSATPKALLVQNKVAIGPSDLVEDRTPAYLSAEPAARCAARGCKLDDTEMWSGTLVPVTCWVTGTEVTNRDTTSAGIAQNPNGVTSRLWYRVVWPDGRAGFLAEIYVAPEYRGGLALPAC